MTKDDFHLRYVLMKMLMVSLLSIACVAISNNASAAIKVDSDHNVYCGSVWKGCSNHQDDKEGSEVNPETSKPKWCRTPPFFYPRSPPFVGEVKPLGSNNDVSMANYSRDLVYNKWLYDCFGVIVN